MIFDRMKAGDQSDKDGVDSNPQFFPNLATSLVVRAKDLAIKPIGNNHTPQGSVAENFMLPCTNRTVVNDTCWMPGEKSAEPDHGSGKPTLLGGTFKGLPNVPKNGHTAVH